MLHHKTIQAMKVKEKSKVFAFKKVELTTQQQKQIKGGGGPFIDPSG